MLSKGVALVIICGLLSCNSPQKIKDENKNLELVRDYFHKAEKLKLPVTWENTSNIFPVNTEKHIRLSEEDSLLFGEETSILTMVGVLPDTSKFYTFLFYYPADDLAPVLITIDKKGNKIDRLITGYSCGADCGYYCVGATFTVNKNNSFVSKHHSYSAECIDNYSRLDTSKVTYTVLEKRGLINNKGDIKEEPQRVIEEKIIPFSSKENPIKYFESE